MCHGFATPFILMEADDDDNDDDNDDGDNSDDDNVQEIISVTNPCRVLFLIHPHHHQGNRVKMRKCNTITWRRRKMESSSSSSSLYLVKKNRMKIGKCNNITWKRRKMERARKTIDYVARAGSWAAAGC